MGLVVENCTRNWKNFCEKEETQQNITIVTEESKNSEKEIRDSNPWNNYLETSTLYNDNFCSFKKVSLISNNEIFKLMKIIQKKYLLQLNDLSIIIKELNKLKSLEHPNLMKIEDFYENENFIYIVSDFYKEGKFLEKLMKLGKMNQISLKYFMTQIFNAIKYAHSQKIDLNIKPENIYIYSNHVVKESRRFSSLSLDQKYKLDPDYYRRSTATKKRRNYLCNIIDYDIKIFPFDCSKYTINNNVIFISPDIIENKSDDKCDEWACGVMMYMLLAGKVPFEGSYQQEILNNMKKMNYNFELKEFKNVSEHCIDLIKKLLEPNGEKRISAEDALNHTFFIEKIKECAIQEKDLYILNRINNHQKFPSRFHEIIFEYLCDHYLKLEEEKRFQEIFKSIDKEGKNKLSKENIINLFKEYYFEFDENKFNEAFDLIDLDHDGYIDYKEFLHVCYDKDNLYSLNNIIRIFEILTGSVDQKTLLTAEDIKKFAFKDGNVSDKEFVGFLEEFGMNLNDNVKFEEFFDFIKNEKKLNEKKEEDKKKDKFGKISKTLSFGGISILERQKMDVESSDTEDNN